MRFLTPEQGTTTRGAMILTRESILKAVESGCVVVDPLIPENVKTNSVDVRITGPFLRMKGVTPSENSFKRFGVDIGTVFPYVSQRETSSQFEAVAPTPLKEIKDLFAGCDDVTEQVDILTQAFGEDHEAWYLTPGHYLAATVERIGATTKTHRYLEDGTPIYLVPDIGSKSTWGRWGLTVCICAGRGDIGYASRWALEVRVDTPTVIIDRTIAGQVRFTEAIGCVGSGHFYGDDKNSYQAPTEEVVEQLPKSLKII